MADTDYFAAPPPRPRTGNRDLINGAINKPTTKFGVDYRYLGACFVAAIVIFLFGSKILACLMLPCLIAAGALLTKREPQMFRLWLLSFKLRSYYDPCKGRADRKCEPSRLPAILKACLIVG